MGVYCGIERVRTRVLVSCACGGLSTVLSGARVLSGFERADGPASAGLGAMPVLKLA